MGRRGRRGRQTGGRRVAPLPQRRPQAAVARDPRAAPRVVVVVVVVVRGRTPSSPRQDAAVRTPACTHAGGRPPCMAKPSLAGRSAPRPVRWKRKMDGPTGRTPGSGCQTQWGGFPLLVLIDATVGELRRIMGAEAIHRGQCLPEKWGHLSGEQSGGRCNVWRRPHPSGSSCLRERCRSKSSKSAIALRSPSSASHRIFRSVPQHRQFVRNGGSSSSSSSLSGVPYQSPKSVTSRRPFRADIAS